jgi:hypothetical protein
MLRPAPGGAIPGRPHRPLVVRCGYDGSTRPVNFPRRRAAGSVAAHARGCCLLLHTDLLAGRRMLCPLRVAVRARTPTTTGKSTMCARRRTSPTPSRTLPLGTMRAPTERCGWPPAAPPKISMRVDVVVEYDGPSLSDTSSIASFRTSEHSWHSSERSAARSDGRSSFEYRSSRGAGTAPCRPSRRTSRTRSARCASQARGARSRAARVQAAVPCCNAARGPLPA